MKHESIFKKFKRLSLFLIIILIFCSCTKQPPDNDITDNSGNETTNTPPNPNQSKLDVLRPTAYGSMHGLNINGMTSDGILVDGSALAPGSYISIIGRNDNDSYWKEVESGAKRAVDDLNAILGYKGDDKIKLSFCAPDIRDDVNEQISILDEELARYPLAICISAVDASACAVQFDLAAENSIPIITYDSGSDYQDITAHVSTDNMEAGETAAANLAALMEGSGEVAVFVQDSFSMTANERESAFVSKLQSDFPDISVVNIYHMDELEKVAQQIADEKNGRDSQDITDSDNSDAGENNNPNTKQNVIDPSQITQEDVVRYILEKYPNLKAIYATNLDATQLVANVLSSINSASTARTVSEETSDPETSDNTASDNISDNQNTNDKTTQGRETSLTSSKKYTDGFYFVGFDGGKEQLALFDSNILDGLIIQNPYGMGYATVVAAVRTVLGLGNEAVVDSGYTWVTKENMTDPEISKMLY